MGRVALLFPYDAIRVSTSIMTDIGFPQYVHLYLERSKHKLYIRACDKAPDAFRINRKAVRNTKTGYSIASQRIMDMLFGLMALDNRELCVKCAHRQIDPVTIEVDLDDFVSTHRGDLKEDE